MMEFPATIDKQIIREMPVEAFRGKIFVIDSETEAREAVGILGTQPLVGVDTETRPSFRKGMMHKVALLQVATDDECFLFRLNHIGLPDFLEDFLQNDVPKVGLSLKDDFAMLRRRNRKDPREGNWVELQDYVVRFGIMEKSLQKIYALLFGRKISKSQRLSNWEADELSMSQRVYAATDAWACVRIFTYLQNLEKQNQCQQL